LKTVAESVSQYNLVEHLAFLLPDSGMYGMEVLNAGDLWNFTGATGEYYGLAWSDIPEPSSILLVLIGLGASPLSNLLHSERIPGWSEPTR